MGLTDRQWFTLRRLHSLSGILPIGVFLANHFFINSFSVGGQPAFNDKVHLLRSLPYLVLIETFGIFLPIAFHAVLGVLIYREAKFNNRRLSYAHNHMFTLQRITGVILIFFISYHVLFTRFAHHFGYDTSDMFTLLHEKFRSPWLFGIYVVGVLAASYHLGNGLFGFSIHWGLATSRAGQRRMARVGMLVAVVFAMVGLNALLGFGPLDGRLQPVRIFNLQEDAAVVETHAAARTVPPPAPSAPGRADDLTTEENR